MASKTERTIINAAGLVQGIVLVTFPAASTIFMDKNEYGLSSAVTGHDDLSGPAVVTVRSVPDAVAALAWWGAGTLGSRHRFACT